MMAYSRARGFRRDYIDARVHEGEAEGEKKDGRMYKHKDVRRNAAGVFEDVATASSK
jgi:hypothetical protein